MRVWEPCVPALAVMGAFMNVRINATGYDDKTYVTGIIQKGKDIQSNTLRAKQKFWKLKNQKIPFDPFYFFV